MPSACTQFASSVEKHTIAVRNAFAPISIHIPKIVDEWKTTASLTENQPYHTAAIDGEMREQARSELPPGRARFIWWQRYFDSLDAIKPGPASPHGQAVAGDFASFADGGAELYFFDTNDA